MLSRALDGARLWLMTVDPYSELFWSVFHQDALQHGLLPHPAMVMHEATSRILLRSVSCFVTAFVAPSDFPFPWRQGEQLQQQQQQQRSGPGQTPQESALHHHRMLSTFCYLTNNGIVSHLFGRLITTRIARAVGNAVFSRVFAPFIFVGTRVLDVFDRLVGATDSELAQQQQEQQEEQAESGFITANSHSAGGSESAAPTSFESDAAYHAYAHEVYSAAVVNDGPVRAMLYRNTIPIITHFVKDSLTFLLFTGLAKSRLIRRILVGRMFHRSQVLPFEDVWRLHFVGTCRSICDTITVLLARGAGAWLGFHFLSYATANVFKQSFAERLQGYVSLPDAALYGESVAAFLTRPLRHRAADRVDIWANFVLYKLAPFDVAGDDDDEEEARRRAKIFDDDEVFSGEDQRRRQQGDEQQQQQRGSNVVDDDIPEQEFEDAQRRDIYTEVDYYAVLGVSRDATAEVVRVSYRKRALQLHPDRVMQLPAAERAAAAEQFKQVQKAYEVLSNDGLRADYDRAQSLGLHDANGPSGMHSGHDSGNGHVVFGIRPDFVTQRFFAAVDRLPHPVLQYTAVTTSAVAAVGMGCVVTHCHIANTFTEWMEPGL